MTQMISRVANRPQAANAGMRGLVAGGQGDNGRSVRTKVMDIFAGLVLMLALAGLATLLGGCTETRYVAVPVPQTAPATPVLQACADHAAVAQREAFGDSFRALQFDASNLVLAAPNEKVGSQEVGAVYDGDGQWFGKPYGTMGEWRAVRFHCLVSPKGNVLYSFLRAE